MLSTVLALMRLLVYISCWPIPGNFPQSFLHQFLTPPFSLFILSGTPKIWLYFLVQKRFLSLVSYLPVSLLFSYIFWKISSVLSFSYFIKVFISIIFFNFQEHHFLLLLFFPNLLFFKMASYSCSLDARVGVPSHYQRKGAGLQLLQQSFNQRPWLSSTITPASCGIWCCLS